MKKRIRRLLLSERGDSSYISSFVYILQPPRLEVAFLHVSAYALDFYILLCYYFND